MIKFQKPNQAIVLDWHAYYQEFARVHGGFPVVTNVARERRQLFRDGWSYSVTSYEGPEWPPPTGEIEARRLRLAYWILRRRDIGDMLYKRRSEFNWLSTLASARSGKLLRKVRYEGRISGTESIDLDSLRQEIDELQVDMAEAEQMIAELR